MTRKQFKDTLTKEFKFFDKDYFKNHATASINFYYSGHGEVNHIKLIDFDTKYSEVISHIFDSLNKQLKEIGEIKTREVDFEYMG